MTEIYLQNDCYLYTHPYNNLSEYGSVVSNTIDRKATRNGRYVLMICSDSAYGEGQHWVAWCRSKHPLFLHAYVHVVCSLLFHLKCEIISRKENSAI